MKARDELEPARGKTGSPEVARIRVERNWVLDLLEFNTVGHIILGLLVHQRRQVILAGQLVVSIAVGVAVAVSDMDLPAVVLTSICAGFGITYLGIVAHKLLD